MVWGLSEATSPLLRDLLGLAGLKKSVSWEVKPESEESLIGFTILDCCLLPFTLLFWWWLLIWCEGDPFVELEPAEDIEHIELFLEPKDELFEGLEGGVWKVNPSDFMSLITCSDTVGNLKGSSVHWTSLLLISSSCWKSVTIEASSSSTGLREATNVQYLDLSSVKAFLQAFFSVSCKTLRFFVSSSSEESNALEAICWSLDPDLDFFCFFWALETASDLFLTSDRSFLYSLAWSLSMVVADFFQSSNLSWRGKTMQSKTAPQSAFSLDSIDLCRITILVKQAPISRVAPLVFVAASAIFWKLSKKAPKTNNVVLRWECNLAALLTKSSYCGTPVFMSLTTCWKRPPRAEHSLSRLSIASILAHCVSKKICYSFSKSFFFFQSSIWKHTNTLHFYLIMAVSIL